MVQTDQLWHKIQSNVALPTDSANVVEHIFGQKVFIAADDDPIGADTMNCEFFDRRLKVLDERDDWYPANCAADEFIGVVEHRYDPAMIRAVRAKKTDIERGQTRLADHNDVLDC